MPERTLAAQHVGMETLNSVGSSGSCDSMDSISSNHSAFSGENYDHLSAEELECLMFLEETIDSLDNEVDSGLSTDESENVERGPNVPLSETVKSAPSPDVGKTSNKIPVQSKNEETPDGKVELDFNKITLPKQAYYSFPRIVQTTKDEVSKDQTDTRLTDNHIDPGKALYGKPKSLSSINQKVKEESSFNDVLLLPPPEPFRDRLIVDKRRSVNDPTDAREVQFHMAMPKFPFISEFKETPAVEHIHDKVISSIGEKNIPRTSSPEVTPNPAIVLSSEVPISFTEKPTDLHFKYGPPTAPKPRKLPPNIILKASTGGGVSSNLETQQRPRAFSAHEKNPESIAKLHQSKEQESARREALQKLGLIQEKCDGPKRVAVKSSVFHRSVEMPVPQGVMEHGRKDAYGKSIHISQQEKTDILSTSPNQVAVQDPEKGSHHVGIDVPDKKFSTKNRLSMKSNSVEKGDELKDSVAEQSLRETLVVDDHSTRSAKIEVISKDKDSLKISTKEKTDEKRDKPSQPLPDAYNVTDGSPKHLKHLIENPPTIKTESQEMKGVEVVMRKPARSPKESVIIEDSVKNAKLDISKNITNAKMHTQENEKALNQAIPPASTVLLNHPPKSDKLQDNKPKVGSLENISILSTSPGKRFSFPRPTEITVPHPEVTLRDAKGRAAADKSHRHSSHMDTSNEAYLHLTKGPVPGLRQMNIKSSTLERSGIGLSSSLSSGEKESQKQTSSFFKNPFSANFLRNSRPRPASLGTGKDFVVTEEPPKDTEKTEGRRSFFSRAPRSSAPVTSVKITPKGSTDEHRREALLKLGILKE